MPLKVNRLQNESMIKKRATFTPKFPPKVTFLAQDSAVDQSNLKMCSGISKFDGGL